MKETKIQFSAAEADLMCDAQVILTKNRIIEKVKLVMEEVQQEMKDEVGNNDQWDKDIFLINPKISKGENYLGLPYIILDYPRRFLKDDVFAIRSMFWWGNFFGITLHLSGHSKKFFLENISNGYSLLCEKNFYICINEDPWAHHFEKTNYQQIGKLSEGDFTEILQTLPHIKIAAKQPLDEWPNAANTFFENWKLLLRLLY